MFQTTEMDDNLGSISKLESVSKYFHYQFKTKRLDLPHRAYFKIWQGNWNKYKYITKNTGHSWDRGDQLGNAL